MKTSFKNRNEVFKYLRSNLLKIGLPEMQKRVGEKFFDMDDIVESIFIAIVSGKNLILWGPGGFGKSEVVVKFLEQASITYSSIIGYEDMDVEGLLGLPNMTKLLEESTYEIAFEKTSFNNPGILILEEFLDVNPKTAIALKDILTSEGYRQGNKFVPSLISSVIICSNRSPYEVSIDTSTTAFYKERFPIVVNVKWNDHSSIRYEAFIKKVVGKDYNKNKLIWEVLAELAYRTTKRDEPVSPRIVKDAIHILQFNEYNLKTLILVDGLDTSSLNEIISSCNSRNENSRLLKIAERISSYLEEILNESTPSSRFIIDSIGNVNYIKDRLNSMVLIDEGSVAILSTVKVKCEQISEALWSKITIDNIPETQESIDNLFSI